MLHICVPYIHCVLFLGVFYFTLGNVNPKFRSKLKSIQLAALVRRVHLVKYGMNAVLRPIVDDLKKLVVCHYVYISTHPIPSNMYMYM